MINLNSNINSPVDTPNLSTPPSSNSRTPSSNSRIWDAVASIGCLAKSFSEARLNKSKADTIKKDQIIKIRLLELPVEIRQYIFSFLGPKELALLSQVSQQIRQSAEDQMLWRSLYKRQYIQRASLKEGEIDWKKEYQKEYQNAKLFFFETDVASFRGLWYLTVQFCGENVKRKLPDHLVKQDGRIFTTIGVNEKATFYQLKQLVCYKLNWPKKQMEEIKIINCGLSASDSELVEDATRKSTLVQLIFRI